MSTITGKVKTINRKEKFYCPCGGEVKMKYVFSEGKLRLRAQCLSCGRTKRKPCEFKY